MAVTHYCFYKALTAQLLSAVDYLKSDMEDGDVPAFAKANKLKMTLL